MKMDVAVFFHNYYSNHHFWSNLFLERFDFPFDLYYNIVSESIYNDHEKVCLSLNFRKNLRSDRLVSATVRLSSNQGKDIGGKLVLLDAYQRLGRHSEIGLFIHDKKSLHKANGREWGAKLLKVTEPWFTSRVLEIFRRERDVGVVAISGSLANEELKAPNSLSNTNSPVLHGILGHYNIWPDSYEYVAGTIFWFRMEPLMSFFSVHRPLGVRESLEKGNVIDEFSESNTHSWERMLTWIITEKGYRIKAIPDA